jgi:hypothetical protein
LGVLSILILGAFAPELASSAGRAPSAGGDSPYQFRAAPLQSMGLTSLAGLRGKPVLIDFWGTR